jgi:hypothetical protein
MVVSRMARYVASQSLEVAKALWEDMILYLVSSQI